MVSSVVELLELGEVTQALELAGARLVAARAADDPAALAVALLDEARAELAHGDRDDAVVTVDEAISRARRGLGPTAGAYAEALELGAEIAVAADMPATAEARFRSAIEVLQASSEGPLLAHALLNHGRFRRAQGDAAGAASAFLEVLTRCRDTQDRALLPPLASAFSALGEVMLEAGQPERARELGDRALEIWLELGKARRVEVADAMALVGSAALRLGDAAAACAFLAPACEIYRGCEPGARARHAAAAQSYASALEADGHAIEARAAYVGALDLFREGAPERLAIEQRLIDLART